MLKRTPGKWDWTNVAGKDGLLRTIIVVRSENDGGLFDCIEEPLRPTTGDFQLVTNAPEMHELIHEFVDEIDEAISQGGVFTEGLHKMRRKASALLQEINVERTNPPANRGIPQKET